MKHDAFCTGICSRPVGKLTKCTIDDCQSSYCEGCVKQIGSPFVCPPCTNGTGGLGDGFSETTHGMDDFKLSINIVFVSAVNLVCKDLPPADENWNAPVLLIDTGATTRRLLEANLNINIVVPNPSKEVFDALGPLCKRGQVHRSMERAGHFLSHMRNRHGPDFGFVCAWMDYCCTYRGNSTDHVKPWHDMRKLWQYGLRRPDGTRRLLAVTFSLRNSRGFGADEIVHEQLKTAKAFGWNAEVAHKEPYGTMVFIIFVAI
jgi:hypothetical protein